MPRNWRKRDYQRSRVYRAEDTVPWTWLNQLETWDETVTFIRWVAALPGFQALRKRYGGWTSWLKLQVKPARSGQRQSYHQAGLISLAPRGARRRAVILHELAHYLNGFSHVDGGHGPIWAAIFIKLTALVEGETTAEHLRQAFEKRGVKIAKRIPRKVPGVPNK